MTFESMSKKELEELHSQLLEKYNSFKAKNLKLDMSRGKPCTQQLDLSMDMLKINDVKSSTGLECRNYGMSSPIYTTNIRAEEVRALASLTMRSGTTSGGHIVA